MSSLTVIPPSNFEPSEYQRRYAYLLLDPAAPSTVGEIATELGVNPETIARWRRDADFRNWLAYFFQVEGESHVPLWWREVNRIATSEGIEPKVRLDALKTLIVRFDHGYKSPAKSTHIKQAVIVDSLPKPLGQSR